MASGFDIFGNYYYVRSGLVLSDTHGGHSAQHLKEFEAVCNEIIDAKLKQLADSIEAETTRLIEEYGKEVWNRMIDSLIGVIHTDIESEVKLGIEGARDLFFGTKCQKFISDTIAKTMKDQLMKIRE